MRRLRRLLGLGLLFGSLFAASGGCKPKESGAMEVKTLDNFAAGDTVRTNACSGDKALAGKPGWTNPLGAPDSRRIKIDPVIAEPAAGRLRQAVADSLAAIPDEMQLMFKSFGGYVNVSPGTNAICTERLRSGRQKVEGSLETVKACFSFERVGTKTRFRINLSPDADPRTIDKEIHHSLVRVFGYVYAQFFARLTDSTDPQFQIQVSEAESFQFANLKMRLAQNFLADMARSRAFDLKVMERYLGAGGAQTVRDNLERLAKRGDLAGAIDRNFDGVPPKTPAVGDEDLLNGVTWVYATEPAGTRLDGAQMETRRRRFEDFVFAEAFDSFLCRTSGAYADAATVEKVKAGQGGEAARNDFLRSVENTKFVMRDFFPLSYGYYTRIDATLKAMAQAYVGKETEPEGAFLTGPNLSSTNNVAAPAVGEKQLGMNNLLAIFSAFYGSQALGQYASGRFQGGYPQQQMLPPGRQPGYQPGMNPGMMPGGQQTMSDYELDDSGYASNVG